jgi:hypothetical protein
MLKKVIFWIFILVLDILLYFIIGFILLSYEDFYNENKGAYWSFESMTLIESVAFIGYYVLISINIVFLIYLVYKFLIKRFLLS